MGYNMGTHAWPSVRVLCENGVCVCVCACVCDAGGVMCDAGGVRFGKTFDDEDDDRRV